MLRRLAIVGRQLLVSVDQSVQVLLVSGAFLLFLTKHPPSADETLSSYVGRADERGAWWARPVARVIDGLFVLLGEEPGHCRRNIETSARGLAPTP